MTAETRILGQTLPLGRARNVISYKPSFSTLVLAIIVMISGIAVVYLSDLNRRVFMDLQDAQSYQNQLRLDWGKLLLEQSTWSSQTRVQSIAEQRLAMSPPISSEIVMIKET